MVKANPPVSILRSHGLVLLVLAISAISALYWFLFALNAYNAFHEYADLGFFAYNMWYDLHYTAAVSGLQFLVFANHIAPDQLLGAPVLLPEPVVDDTAPHPGSLPRRYRRHNILRLKGPAQEWPVRISALHCVHNKSRDARNAYLRLSCGGLHNRILRVDLLFLHEKQGETVLRIARPASGHHGGGSAPRAHSRNRTFCL